MNLCCFIIGLLLYILICDNATDNWSIEPLFQSVAISVFQSVVLSLAIKRQQWNNGEQINNERHAQNQLRSNAEDIMAKVSILSFPLPYPNNRKQWNRKPLSKVRVLEDVLTTITLLWLGWRHQKWGRTSRSINFWWQQSVTGPFTGISQWYWIQLVIHSLQLNSNWGRQ